MNITVNGTPVTDQWQSATNLEEILVDLSRNVVPQDHLVGTVKLNGEEFSESYAGQARDIEIVNVNDLDVTTVPLKKLAFVAMKDSTIFLERIITSVKKTAELFRLYDEAEANGHYANLIESLRALYQFIDMTQKTINWDFNASMYNGQPVQKEWERLISLVDELREVQEEGDWILLADVLEYELATALSNWKKILKEKVENYNFS